MPHRTLVALIAFLPALPAAAVNVPPPVDAGETVAPIAPIPPLAPAAPTPPQAPLRFAAADAPAAPTAEADAWRGWSRELQRELEMSLGALYAPRVASSKVVKDAPFSAEVITENRQALADGNVIRRTSAGRFYRDRDGRTREETDARDGKPGSIVITDPVAHRRIVLLPGAKRALVSAEPPQHASHAESVTVDGTEVRVEDGRVTVNGKEVAGGRVQLKAKSGREIRVDNGHILVDGKEAGPGHGSGTQVIVKRDTVDGLPTEIVSVEAMRVGDEAIPVPPIPPIPPMPPMPAHAPGALAPPPPPPALPGIDTLRFESTARLGPGVTAALGTRDIEGVRAEGKSTTWTIAAGRIGNRDPIKVVSESWYSPDLQVTVYSRYSDPRTGEAIYRLAAVKRAPPDAALFQVPAGYEVRDRARFSQEIHEQAREARERALEMRQRMLEERRRMLEEQRRQLDEQRRELEEERRKAG